MPVIEQGTDKKQIRKTQQVFNSACTDQFTETTSKLE